MNGRKGKSGQIAIFLVLILAGLVLMFALNVDIFTSARSKIRLQNAADASALALARWQGATLNLIGDLNLAHLAAVCQSNRNAIAGIVALQQRLAFMGPTVGFKAANDLARENRIAISPDMTRATRLVADFHLGQPPARERAAFGNRLCGLAERIKRVAHTLERVGADGYAARPRIQLVCLVAALHRVTRKVRRHHARRVGR